MIESLLRRDRLVTAVGLALLVALAWGYLLSGAGTGMSAWEMTRLALVPQEPAGMDPHMAMAAMPGMDSPKPWTLAVWALTAAMWWTMMVAMMTPTAAPTILLYARVHRQAGGTVQAARLAPTGAFAVGYLLAWLAFSLAAAGLQWGLQRAGWLSAETLGSQSRWLSAGVLIAAGLYQLSPLQGVCLSHCRSPAAFLTRHWRPGGLGAVRLGVLHGAYCLGCCWLLMGLLFVGGVMNLAWIAALTLLVLAEKLVPGGRWIARGAGAVLLIWGAVILAP